MLLRRAIQPISLALLQLHLWSSRTVLAQLPTGPSANGEPQIPEPVPLPHPELPPPELPVVAPDHTLLWILGVCVTLAFVVLAWALWQRRTNHPPALPKARKEALSALRNLRDQSDITAPGDAAASVSAIVRKYLQVAYQVPAPRRTSRELFHRPDAPPQVRSLAPLGELWDRLAYGPAVDSRAEVHSLIEKAIVHLEAEPEHWLQSPPPTA